jgi:hypothetical protein
LPVKTTKKIFFKEDPLCFETPSCLAFIYRCTQGGESGVRGDKMDLLYKIFAKFVNKNAIQPQKDVPATPKFSQPLYTLPPKIWHKPYGSFPRIFNPCASMCLILEEGCLSSSKCRDEENSFGI